MDHARSATNVKARTARIRRESSRSEADKVARQMDIVDLVVNGANVRQIAEHYKVSMQQIRDDYTAGLALLTTSSVDRSLQLREEVTLRQLALIFANMPHARAGDKAAAAIVNGCDQLLTSIWGLKYLKPDAPLPAPDAGIAGALEGYLQGLRDSIPATSTVTAGNGHRNGD